MVNDFTTSHLIDQCLQYFTVLFTEVINKFTQFLMKFEDKLNFTNDNRINNYIELLNDIDNRYFP